MKQPPIITTADVEGVLTNAANVRDELTDLILLIASGHCDDIADPGGYARRCLNTSRVYANATSIFLAREELQRGDANRPYQNDAAPSRRRSLSDRAETTGGGANAPPGPSEKQK